MSFKHDAISGVRWTALSTAILATTQLVTTGVLTRYLVQSDFGVMAIILVVKGFAELFMDFGLTVAILHKPIISQNEYSSLYWINMITGFIIYVFLWFGTPFIALFYHEPDLQKLIPLMCLAIPFSAIGKQQKTILQKELFFKSIAIVDIFSSVCSFGMAIYLAVNNWGIYALIYSNLMRYVLSNVVYFIVGIQKKPIRFHFSFNEIKPFLKIGMYNTGGQMINYFSSTFDVLIIGRLLGADALGVYNLAKELVLKPSAMLSPILSRVITPLFSKIQNQKEYLLDSFVQVQKIVSNINAYIYIGIALLSAPIVSLYYGENYERCVPLVSILAIYYLLREYAQPMCMVCIAKGRTDIDMWWNVFALFVSPLIIYIAASYSIKVVAISLLIYAILMLYPGWYIYSKRLLSISFSAYYKELLKSLKLFLIPALFTVCLLYFINLSSIVTLLFGGVIYTVIVLLVLIKYEKKLLLIVSQLFK